MRPFFKARVYALILIVLIAIGLLGYLNLSKKLAPVEIPPAPTYPIKEVLGKSVEGRNIESYTFGNGEKTVAFIGGVHGGYEWNSSLLSYQFIDYLSANPEFVPEGLKVIVIPSANPDGLYKVIGKEGRFTLEDAPKEQDQSGLGRFNANDVDLNRNFDCNWQATSTWRTKVVSGGSAAFSEPESRVIRDFVLKNNPVALVFWHSQANAVYASECNDGILPMTLQLMNAYSKASGYPTIEKFNSYKISGDAEGWLASIGIPAITVELKTHATIEWSENLAGIRALLQAVI